MGAAARVPLSYRRSNMRLLAEKSAVSIVEGRFLVKHLPPIQPPLRLPNLCATLCPYACLY
jgi:hypothetical protein